MAGVGWFFPSDHRSKNNQNSYAYAQEHEQGFSCPSIALDELWTKMFESGKDHHKNCLKLSLI